MSFQGERQYEKIVSEVTKQLDQFKSWNNLPSLSKLVRKGMAIQSQKFDLIKNYEFVRVTKDTFLVRYMHKRKILQSSISKWGNIRQVKFLTTNHAKCSCYNQRRLHRGSVRVNALILLLSIAGVM